MRRHYIPNESNTIKVRGFRLVTHAILMLPPSLTCDTLGPQYTPQGRVGGWVTSITDKLSSESHPRLV